MDVVLLAERRYCNVSLPTVCKATISIAPLNETTIGKALSSSYLLCLPAGYSAMKNLHQGIAVLEDS